MRVNKFRVLGLTLLFLLAGLIFALSQEEVKDPVCGMELKKSEAKFKSDYKGMTYYFCSADCKAKFEKEPEKFAGKVEEKKHKEMPVCCALSEDIMKNVKVEREEVEKGLVLTFTSSDPDTVKKLQENTGKCKMKEHAEMEQGSCCLMHRKEVKSEITNIKDGVRVELTSENPDTVKELKKKKEGKSCCGKEEHKH